MLNSTVLDVGVGLIFVFLVLGLMCTTVNEWIAQFFDMRATTLREGIKQLLGAVTSDRGLFRPENLHIVKLVRRLTTVAFQRGRVPLYVSDLSNLRSQALATSRRTASASRSLAM
jgi:hypothetical protein